MEEKLISFRFLYDECFYQTRSVIMNNCYISMIYQFCDVCSSHSWKSFDCFPGGLRHCIDTPNP